MKLLIQSHHRCWHVERRKQSPLQMLVAALLLQNSVLVSSKNAAVATTRLKEMAKNAADLYDPPTPDSSTTPPRSPSPQSVPKAPKVSVPAPQVAGKEARTELELLKEVLKKLKNENDSKKNANKENKKRYRMSYDII